MIIKMKVYMIEGEKIHTNALFGVVLAQLFIHIADFIDNIHVGQVKISSVVAAR